MNERVYFTTKKRRRILKKKKKRGKVNRRRRRKAFDSRESERAVCLFVCFVGDLLFPLANSARSSRGLFFFFFFFVTAAMGFGEREREETKFDFFQKR